MFQDFESAQMLGGSEISNISRDRNWDPPKFGAHRPISFDVGARGGRENMFRIIDNVFFISLNRC